MILKTTTLITTAILGIFGTGAVMVTAWDKLHAPFMTYESYMDNELDKRIIDRARQLESLRIDGAPATKIELYQGELNTMCDQYLDEQGKDHVRC